MDADVAAGAGVAALWDGLAARVAALDWPRIGAELDEGGVGLTGPLLTEAECRAARALHDQDALFRTRIDMRRHGFGSGAYGYFAAPTPPWLAALRAASYPPLARIANQWMARLGRPRRYPARLDAFLDICAAEGQTRPTPLLLRYGPGDYNCLHQDLYGDLAFPLQLVVLLSAPGREFTGGEVVLTEQRPRMQSRVEVAPLALGEAAVFATAERPRRGARGDHQVKMRHGVSRIRSGERFALGVIFHNAR